MNLSGLDTKSLILKSLNLESSAVLVCARSAT